MGGSSPRANFSLGSLNVLIHMVHLVKLGVQSAREGSCPDMLPHSIAGPVKKAHKPLDISDCVRLETQ